jgi:diadenylate cyclase
MDWSVPTNVWRNVMEILILAVGIYYAYRFLRRTRGAPIVNGLLILLALTFLATVLQLEVLTWLLRGFFGLSAVALLIIFQPELRRILAELGNQSMFTSTYEQREAIEVIVQTVERLSDVRIGALMAIQQTIQLKEAVGSSILVDCEATPEMLETIFFPNNAIHDGGVVIIGDRIAYAACIFPLTQRQDLNKSLGTRHRAALGLSEETDAIVVAVSEETGAVSYAHKGQLTRGVTFVELRAFLSSLLVRKSRGRNFFDWFRASERPKAPAATAATPPQNGFKP